ncbi:hypothetical protein J5N97_022690 [Dioscorea zingiberensis]|uniref:V-ATPase proteolipid subunit C-like domain-containing protein n=1 Tax=Dioscorea zingiberensis TaxID=325984 RepID=A0A9D5HB84_9LILI|nr:hypothetical protein J5N97_022690 [Dioscorea zingiberensis]
MVRDELEHLLDDDDDMAEMYLTDKLLQQHFSDGSTHSSPNGHVDGLDGERANAQQPKLFVGMIIILIFAEALALYGLIVGIVLSSRAGQSCASNKH